MLGISHRRHDLTAVTVSDPRERELPDVGFVTLRDAETGELVELDTHHPRIRELFARQASIRERALSDQFRKLGIDQLSVDTHGDHALSLKRFFAARERRRAFG
jgi:uncharacterized protein (DUF58 family)